MTNETTVQGTVQPSSKPKPAMKKHTTPDEVKLMEVLFDENKAWQRTNSKDKTLHRIVHVSPAFFGVTGEDLVNIADSGEKPVLVHACIYNAHVVRYEEKKGPDGKPVKVTLGEFKMEGTRFLEEFCAAD
jgi:hypothetical protein